MIIFGVVLGIFTN